MIKLVARSRRAGAVAAVLAAATAASFISATTAGAVGQHSSTVVSSTPMVGTPDITNGQVNAITGVGTRIISGGTFTSAANHGSTATVARSSVLAFDAATGALSTTFAPTLDGVVQAVEPGPIADTVYVGGTFSTVNGVKSKGITLLSTITGAIVGNFKSPSLNGSVYGIRLSGGRLYVAGIFTTTTGSVAHGGIAALNPTTGAVDPFMNVQLAGHHNYNGSGANGGVGPRALDISPDGKRLIAIGNFKTADGLPRDQIVMIDLDTPTATVDPNWSTLQFTAACFSGAFDTYVTDVEYSVDGSFFAVTATGGSGTNTDGSRSLCDSASRWEASSTGSNVQPTWVDYTGQDTLWSVAITDSAVYVGGHQRWLNNSNGYDQAGAGAVPRPGLAALDPNSGVPLAWNPGRNPRGGGAYALYASPTGLYVGSDTDYIGNFKIIHRKIAYFPLAGGTAPAATTTASLPSNIYFGGQLPTASNTNYLYRVNAAGPAVAAIDNGPDWMADASDTDPGAAYRTHESNAAGWSPSVTRSSTLPASTPNAIFDSERYDGGSKNDGHEMHWDFPVAAGTAVQVRLYFSNHYSGTSTVGSRVFDVAVDGSTVLNNYDIVADTGNLTGTMKAFNVTSPGDITIDLTHEVENPLINGIEIVKQSSTPAPSLADLAYRPDNGTTIGALTTVSGTGVDWSLTRGAFAVGNSVFFGSSNGNFYKAGFDGANLTNLSVVDPYNDPAWSSVVTGSGQTYQGAKPNYYNEMMSVTGAFFSKGKLYYTLVGSSNLYWRWFSPDSGIIGSAEYTVATAPNLNDAGMFLSGNTLYYASLTDGTLHTRAFNNGAPDATTDAVISGPAIDGNDWRAHSLFLYGPATFPNQLPTATATSTCTGLTCSFDGSQSADTDGTIASYNWNFGDGTTGSGATPTHGYSAAGTYSVTLTVTDNRGGVSSAWSGTVTTVSTAVPISFVGSAHASAAAASASVVAPAGISAGDTELLYVSTGTAGVTTNQPAGLTGWTQIGRQTNGTLETTVFRRTATAGDSGSSVSIALASSAHVNLELAVYTGVSTASQQFAASSDSNTATHVTPALTTTAGGAWLISYWADRSSTTSAWTYPAGAVNRDLSLDTGGGRVTAVLGDSGAPLTTGTYGSLTATANSVSGKGVNISIALVPGS
jgi:PKD repeat protein